MATTSSRKNAFAYFVEEYEAEQIARGRKITRKQILNECASGWGELDPETRLRYCNMANPMLDRDGKPGEKTPTNMEWLDPVTGEYGEKWFRYVRSGDELHYLKTTITNEKKLRRFSFYLVHFNYFCKPSQKKYVPAELALVEFNLGEGIKNVYHTLINPGSIPLGFANEAKRLSQEGHGIPVPPHSKGERDTVKIVEAVKRFLKYGTGPTGKFPPLFTQVDNVLPAMHMLNDMVPYNEDQPVFTVYPTHRMFSWIKNKCSDICGRGAGLMDESFALKEIERDCFRYIVEIACDFHKQSDSCFPMCSQSIAKRLAFTICDHCCRDLNITLVGGKHVHRNFRDSSLGEKPKDEEKCKKENEGNEGNEEKKEPEPENVELEEDMPLEKILAKYCRCGDTPDFVGGYSTKEMPADDLVKLAPDEIQLFCSSFIHNLMEGEVKIDPEQIVKEDQTDGKTASDGKLSGNPFAQTGKNGRDKINVGEEVDTFRVREIRKIKNIIIAHIRAQQARESRKIFESKIAEVAKAKIEGKEVKSAHEKDKVPSTPTKDVQESDAESSK